MTKRVIRMQWNEMRPEIPIGIAIGLIAAIWKFVVGGAFVETLGIFIITATLVEWLGSIFFKRSHELTQDDIYKQMLLLREKIRGFDDDER